MESTKVCPGGGPIFAVVFFGSHPPPSLTPSSLCWAAKCANVHLFSLEGGGGVVVDPNHTTTKKSGIHPIYYSMYAYEWRYTDKNVNENFLIYKEIQIGSVAMSYMRKGFLIHEEMLKHLTINEEAVSHIWLCNRSLLNFLIYKENLIFYFISVEGSPTLVNWARCWSASGWSLWVTRRQPAWKNIIILFK
jgi:hypothetical protein